MLLGFAATDFVITMTLSAADAAAHVTENPYVPAFLHGQELWITLGLLALLGAVFLRGFKEAIGIAVVLVGIYLVLNVVVLAVALGEVARPPGRGPRLGAALTAAHGSPVMMVAVALMVFPQLALGLSGFETGVAVMPHVRGTRRDAEAQPRGRIRGTKRLLTTAAVIMSVFLVASSVRHDPADPGRRLRARAARRTAGPWPTWRTSTSATASARCTTSPRSRSSGSPAPRRWPGCST